MIIFETMASNDQIKALISLLDDPDENIYSHIRKEIVELGNKIVPALENAWESSFDNFLQSRIEELIHEIQFTELKGELITWKKAPEKSLLQGAILIARYQYPDLDVEAIERFVQQLTQDIWIELNPDLTALEKVKVMNRIFFDIHGFSGNKKNFHSPRNSYINNVIEGKKGNPVSLGLLYIEVASRLRVPVYGVNLPEHFVLAYTSLPIEFFETVQKEDVLFYINSFNRGNIFNEKEIKSFLKQLKLSIEPEYFVPCDSLTIIKRILNNLIYSYDKSGYVDKKEELMILLGCLDD